MNDIRSTIHRLVSAINPLDKIEEEHIHFVQKWIESGCEIFRIEKPATPDTHLVCYCVVVSHELDQILLVDHKNARLWLPPGGHVDPGEDPKGTVRRETKEELGIEAKFFIEDPVFLTVNNTEGTTGRHTDVSLWYVIKVDPTIHLVFDTEEFHQIRWFKFDEIPYSKSEPHLTRFLQKLQKEYACHNV